MPYNLNPTPYALRPTGVGVRGGAQGRGAVPGSGGLRVGARDV